MNLRNLINENLKNKRIFLRADLNVPIYNKKITDFSRISNIKEIVNYISNKGGKIVLASHFGRPDGNKKNKFSLKQILKPLKDTLNKKIVFIPETIGKYVELAKIKQTSNEIILLENLRFHKEEEENDSNFSFDLSKNCDIFVNEAFSCCHRKHASIYGITKYLPSFAGPSLINEVNSINKIFINPKKPIAAIVGGSKISTKLPILENLIKKMDFLIIVGAMANTFLKSKGLSVGKSIYEKELINTAKNLLRISKSYKCKIILPIDVITAPKLDINQKIKKASLSNIDNDQMILDIGSKSLNLIITTLKGINTILWNGPLGAFETKPFHESTIQLAKFIAMRTEQNSLISIAGGGDTLSALKIADVYDKLTYVSIAGGAFLEMLEGKKLPGIEVLES